MSTVDFITFCYWKDMYKLHTRDVLRGLVESHQYPFDNIIVVHQRCRDRLEHPLPEFDMHAISVFSEDHPNILTEFGIPEDDPVADEWTHGPDAAHYWKWHTINHLIGLKVSTADYIVFCDSDCRIIRQPSSWVEAGIKLLIRHKKVLIIAPSDGGKIANGGRLPGGIRLTQNVSQQIFLCERERLRGVDFNIPWNWEFLAPWGPFQEYYYMLEGRLWRYMHHNKLYRAMLPERWRYWHGPR